MYYLKEALLMNRTGKTLAALLACLLLACIAAAWFTRDTTLPRAPEQASVVDRRLLDTTRQLTALAETAPEIDLARQAERSADHELDQAYVTAVREAAESKPVSNSAVQSLTAKVTAGTSRI